MRGQIEKGGIHEEPKWYFGPYMILFLLFSKHHLVPLTFDI